MTWDEFKADWLPNHCAAFTGVRPWLAKVSHGSEAPTETQVLRGWYGVLRDVELTAAKEASHQMHSGEIEEPKGFDRHPAAIRKACGVVRRKCESATPRYDADGNRMYSCLLCMDDGWVRCWHPATVSQIAKEGFSQRGGRHQPLYTGVLPCTCRAGDTVSRCFPKSPKFDPKRALTISLKGVSDSDEQANLLTWLKTREPIRPVNYEPAFADYS